MMVRAALAAAAAAAVAALAAFPMAHFALLHSVIDSIREKHASCVAAMLAPRAAQYKPILQACRFSFDTIL
jgi:hypothetical protein